MQKINLIAQSVLELSHCENSHNEDEDDDGEDDNNTHQGWVIVRGGMYSVADKKRKKERKKERESEIARASKRK